MRIDVVSIFPEFFDSLELSLIGRARTRKLLDIAVHNLREWTEDRHRTVDDTPYGGGAGMVMTPEPWGRALDQLCTTEQPTIIFPSPAGDVFTQDIARELAREQRIVFACGRYEGIDERVYEYAKKVGAPRLISLGDYVLNGGEVAAFAMIEAIARLVPGVLDNPESLTEESHENGLLEYPSYTKPAQWRGYQVPEILLSGNHEAIRQWRHQQQLERTRHRRPDLLLDATDRNGSASQHPKMNDRSK